MKKIIFLITLLFLVGCTQEQLILPNVGDETFCDEEANRLGVSGDYHCDFYNGKMNIFFERNELNEEIYEENK